MIKWNGISSNDINVIVESHPAFSFPMRKHETVSIPGRNGDLIYVEDAYKNYEQSYEITLSPTLQNLPLTLKEVSEWLLGSPGYHELEDSYDVDTYRYASFEGPLDISNHLCKIGRTTLTFNCKPQRYLKKFKNYIYSVNQSGYIIFNPTRFTALPLITIYGSGAGSLNIGDFTINISDIDEYVVMDCETMECYKNNVNKNYTITLSNDSFPKLYEGNTEINFSGGVTTIQILPRWWTL